MNNEKEKAPLNKVEGAESKDFNEDDDKIVEEIYLNDEELRENFRKLTYAEVDFILYIDELITEYGYFSMSDDIPQEPLLKMFKLLFKIRKTAILSSQELQKVKDRLKKNSEILSDLRNAVEKKEC